MTPRSQVPTPDRVNREAQLEWQLDQMTTRDGVVVPVRATARRPRWQDLPPTMRRLVEQTAGGAVVTAESTGTGFTPGFASRLTLEDGQDVFVKAASSADDAVHGWPLSDAYRDEVRKLSLLPDGIGAPAMLWHRDVEVDGVRWIIVAFEYVEGAPPRRPWRLDQLRLVLDTLAATAPALTRIPAGLELETAEEHLMTDFDERLRLMRDSSNDQRWLDTVERLCRDGSRLLAGQSIVHMDLRDDNVLIGVTGCVWFVDWNWPVSGADWIDTLCVLLSARGDGLDVEAELAQHPLTREVDPVAIDGLLAALWSFWGVSMTKPVPLSSPHLRDHQTWYAEVTRDWLTERLRAQ
ncbi:MAG: phosphotransferase [Nocardioidaceae bacterium]|nr:phosphotransferase [Nocardioidaceae bacterium]